MAAEWLRPVDEQILEYLREHPPEYIPLVANRLGVHLKYAEQRFVVLVDHGLVQPVTNEVIYGITEQGERLLADRKAAAAGSVAVAEQSDPAAD
jgi:predicted ArsR family transcriptional regulator